jgi:uncharacterized coiled-coil DUF342 family protein
MRTALAIILMTVVLALPACGLNRTEYERLRAMRDEYLAQLSEIRQNNETINRNIASAYQELEVLRNRLAERSAQGRDFPRAE